MGMMFVPNTAMPGGMMMIPTYDAEDPQDLEECIERLNLLAEHLKMKFVVDTKEERYQNWWGTWKTRQVETLKLKNL